MPQSDCGGSCLLPRLRLRHRRGTGVSQAKRPRSYTPEQQIFPPQIPVADPFDRTKDFSAADISENKVFSMITYLMGPLGVIIALLAAQESPYVAFHVKQSLKLTVLELLGAIGLALVCTLLFYSRLRIFMLFVLSVAFIGLFILHFSLFLQVCKGHAKEFPLIRNFDFLK